MGGGETFPKPKTPSTTDNSTQTDKKKNEWKPTPMLGVKRACNECQQQKLRCDVVEDPFKACGRCPRLGLDCKVDSNFKRRSKRNEALKDEESGSGKKAQP